MLIVVMILEARNPISFEHILFGIRSWSHTKPHTNQIQVSKSMIGENRKLQMNRLILRNNWLKFKTARKLPFILKEFMEYAPRLEVPHNPKGPNTNYTKVPTPRGGLLPLPMTLIAHPYILVRATSER